jgi:hypothetical protein
VHRRNLETLTGAYRGQEKQQQQQQNQWTPDVLMSSKSNGNSRHVMKRRSKEVVVSLFSLSSGNSRQKFQKVHQTEKGQRHGLYVTSINKHHQETKSFPPTLIL